MNAVLKGLGLAGGALGFALAAPAGVLAAVRPPTPSPTVTVDNTRPVSVAVYLERGDLDTRIGTVAAGAKASLTVPAYLGTEKDFRVVVQPKLGVDLMSQEVTVPKVGTIDVLVPRDDEGYVPPLTETIPNPGVHTTTLTVANSRANDVTVYLQHGVFDTKLGTVPADGIRTLDVPAWLVREAPNETVYAHPTIGLDVATQDLTLTRGAHVEVQIPGA